MMKAGLWTLLFSVLLVASAEAQQSAFPTATNSLKTNTPFRPPSPDTRVEFQSATNLLATNTPPEIAELRAKAEKGDAAAQMKLGVMYERGIGVQMDFAEAEKWQEGSNHIFARFGTFHHALFAAGLTDATSNTH